MGKYTRRKKAEVSTQQVGLGVLTRARTLALRRLHHLRTRILLKSTPHSSNVVEVESDDRDLRETTPCSSLRDPETIKISGSTTRQSSSNAVNREILNTGFRVFPTTIEMDEFFTGAEQHHQRDFVEKYNYDPVHDCPLPGRYEWVKLKIRT